MRIFSAATLGPALTGLIARAGSFFDDVRSSAARFSRAAAARSRDFFRRALGAAARVRGSLPSADRFRAGLAAGYPFLYLRTFVPARRAEALILLSGLALGGGAAAPAARRLLPLAVWTPRRVALTFDDGPHPAFTDRLLDVLRRGGAHATFFVVGSQAEKNPRLLEDILRRGCELGNHTYDHPPLTRLRRADLLAELDRTQALLDRAGARGARFFRPPGGRFDAKVLATARAAGYQMVLWTVLPRDHEFPPKEIVRRRVLEDVQDGGVILLHSGVESTAEALPGLLEELRARGFQCVSVGELLDRRRAAENFEGWLNASSLPRRPSAPARGAATERPPEEALP